MRRLISEHPKTGLSTVSLASNIRLNTSPHLKLSRPDFLRKVVEVTMVA
jgi:hypothetical protein